MGVFQAADFVSLAVFCGMAFGCTVVGLKAMFRFRAHGGWILSFLCLTLLFSVLAVSGVTAAHPIPTAPLLMLGLFVWGICFCLSASGRRLAEGLSLAGLVGIQGFRLPLEVILHHWAKIGTIPTTMTWTGSNWDILSGVVALAFVPIVQKRPRLAWVPCLLGSILLVNVLRVVVMSSPFPFSWELDPPLLLVMYFPYALIAPLFVLPAFVGHFLLFLRLRGVKGTRAL